MHPLQSTTTSIKVAPETRARGLNTLFAGASAQTIIAAVCRDQFVGSPAALSSFGAESAVLLALMADVNPAVPVLFLDTHKLFPETIEYRDTLIYRLGLTAVRSLSALPDEIHAEDPSGYLHLVDPDACCHLRKTVPLAQALEGFDAALTGRKRFQSGTRAKLEVFEADGPRIRVNPLANWTTDDIAAEMQRRNLPPHPLVAEGYPSIGCAPCTTPVAPGEDPRAGRWRGSGKVECGIHLGADGKFERAAAR